MYLINLVNVNFFLFTFSWVFCACETKYKANATFFQHQLSITVMLPQSTSSLTSESLANSCIQFINMEDVKLQISLGGDSYYLEKNPKNITVLMPLKTGSNFINFEYCSALQKLVSSPQKTWKLTFTSVLKITISGFFEINNSNIYSIHIFSFKALIMYCNVLQSILYIYSFPSFFQGDHIEKFLNHCAHCENSHTFSAARMIQLLY